MTTTTGQSCEERTRQSRNELRPEFQAGKAVKARPRDLLIRFALGALTSIVSGIITLVFSPRAGGILLAFPAILAASLTLIAEQEGNENARDDARGAVLGGLGMAVFALVALLSFGSLALVPALACAAVAWLLTAVGLYVLLWWH